MALLLLPKGHMHGRVTIEEPTVWIPPRFALDANFAPRYQHTVPSRLQAEVPPGITVELAAYGQFGERRFNPVSSFDAWRHAAWALGFAFFCNDHELDAQHRQSYRIEKFIFDKAQRSKYRIERSFRRFDELANVFGRKPELREDLIAAGAPAEAFRSLKSFSELGRRRARDDGRGSVSEAETITYAFLACAEAAPFSPPLGITGAAAIVRRAVFDETRVTERVSPEIVEEVERRFVQVLWNRSERNYKKLDNWLFGAKTNFVGSLVRLFGELRLSDNQIRAGLAAAFWKSYTYFVQCLDCWAYHFTAALPQPLTATEKRRFDARFVSRAHFGGLPLIMLERIPLLQPIRGELLERPDDPQLIGVAQRLLWYYGRLCEDRRTIDRDNKQREKKRCDRKQITDGNEKPGKPTRGKRTYVGNVGEMADFIEDRRGLSEDETQQMLRRALARDGVRCPHGDCELAVNWGRFEDGPATVNYSCRRHAWQGTRTWTHEEMSAVLSE